MTTIWAKRALLPEGWAKDVAVTLEAGRIAKVTTDVAPVPGATQCDVLLPALTNLHSHAFQRAMAGLTEARGPDPRDSFWTWRALMYRFLDHLTPDHVEAIAAFVQMQMLEAGYAAQVEFHYLHHAPGGGAYADPAEMSARIAAAAAQTGIGLTLAPVFYQYGGCDQRPLQGGQLRFGCDLDRYARLLGGAEVALAALPADARIAVAPHSLRAVSVAGLTAATRLRPEAPLHMHLAEQQAEVDEVLASRGARPVDWLLAHAAVDQRWCLIHCTQMTPAETRALAATGAVAGLCPITESSLGDGIFPAVDFLGHGGVFGIGSDSNIRISLSEELRTLEYSQRLRDRGRAVLASGGESTGRRLYTGALTGGGRAAGRDTGVIQPGMLADLVAIDGDHTDLAGLEGDQLLDTWIFAADDRVVREVWAAGRHQVQSGQHIERESITRAYRRTLTELRRL